MPPTCHYGLRRLIKPVAPYYVLKQISCLNKGCVQISFSSLKGNLLLLYCFWYFRKPREMSRQVLAEDQVEQFLNSQNTFNRWVSAEWLQYPEFSALEGLMQQRMSAFFLSNGHFFLIAAYSLLASVFC